MTDARQILSLRASGNVQRCHTNQHHGSYTVAEHVGHAVCLLLALHPDPSVELVRAVAFHDHPELWSGDVPAPAKRRVPELARLLEALEEQYYSHHPLAAFPAHLDENGWRWLKGVDYLELYLWCRDQELLGNRHAEIIGERVVGYMAESDTPVEILALVEQERRMTWRERCFE